MAFTENLDVFLADFGVSVTAGAVSGFGILDMPGELVADGMIITTDYSLRCEASKFGGLIYGAAITVDGNSYEVRENRLIEDGAFCMATLTKVDGPVGTVITTLNSLMLITQDGRYLVTL
jgi:hypothetical protein